MGNSPHHGPDAGDDHRPGDVPADSVTIVTGTEAIKLGGNSVSISRRWLRAMFFLNILTAALAILLLALGLKTLSTESQRLARGAQLASEAIERISLEVREQARLNACLTLKIANRQGIDVSGLDSPACHVQRPSKADTKPTPFPPGADVTPNGHVEETAPVFPGDPAPPQQPVPPAQSPQPGPPPPQSDPQPSPSPTFCVPVLNLCI